MQESDPQVADALRRADVEAAPAAEKEKQLLRFVALLTKHAYRTTQSDVDNLRRHGWSDPEIAEAIYIAALFAFFNRVADGFGLEDPGYGV